MKEYFAEPNYFGANVKVELNLSCYATKADLKNETGIDTSYFAKKNDLANLKSDIDTLDIDKLKNVSTKVSNLKSRADKLDADKLVTVLVDLSKLNNVVKTDLLKKYVCNAKIKYIDDKIPDITNTTHNSKKRG